MIENDAFKLLLINLFHLNPDDITNIVCTTFNKMMVLLVTLADKHQACPYCRFYCPKIKGVCNQGDHSFSSYHTEMHNKIQGKTLQMSMLWKDLL